MKEKMEFKTETKRLLDMMINSIYTHKEIFLRELISNASDAIDKRHYLSLTDSTKGSSEYQILVEADKENRTLTITDNGIGMTKEELIEHLGTIAKSGSKEFLEKIEKEKTPDVDIIGQFGVGFYSAFMVAKEISVYTKSVQDGSAHVFTSLGLDSYDIDECQMEDYGTKIVISLRENTEDITYDEYLDEYQIKELIKKYSDYVRYPIKTWVTKYDPKPEGEEEKEDQEERTHLELETINSMLPIWKKNKSEVTDEELNNFYKAKFMDYQDPISTIHVNVEGMLTYNALLFIPKKPIYDFNDRNERGLQLYTKGVFILDKCKDLIPEYLRFVKGLVDSADLPLNISREMLQEDRSIKKIATNVEKKILSDLGRMLKNDREKYEEFFNDYGVNLKFGLYEEYGAKKESLKDLIILSSLNEEKRISFAEYKEKMIEGQKEIYYAVGKDKEAVMKLPQMDLIKNKGFDVLILSDDVDEFMLQVLSEYDGVKFKSINQGDLDLIDEEAAKKIDSLKEEKKDILEDIKKTLPECKDVVFSKRLVDAPCCLTAAEGLSFEMERVLQAQHQGHGMKAERILEINPNHSVFQAIEKAYEKDKDSLGKYASLLYTQALLMEGILPSDPQEFSNSLCELMVNSVK
ncbi:MAG: molecular chaperone HtpG [Anaeroplasmataceae bacterium]|jgi:Molecular chaperone, HSP90 family|nr:molecular chaperone HtpG [Anaeroplasmataceae bacterium]HRF70995.1 molecular chaperone HtpG [Candidatus Pelethenecus sp.]